MTPIITEVDCKRFAEQAGPHAWVITADNLHSQAVALYAHRDMAFITERKATTTIRRSETNRATFLLGGFALENLIKAFIVYENPSFIAGGRLAKQLKSHKLIHLSERTKLLPHYKYCAEVLSHFEAGLESWARYPCALTVEQTREEGILTDLLWKNYLKTMDAYGSRLVPLLAKGWTGPDGENRRLTTTGLSFCDVNTAKAG